MFKFLSAAVLSFACAAAFAATDVNKAGQAELEAVKGIGPSIATKIVDERKKGNFKDWNDLVTRVQGIGETNAAKLSEGGLTVNGTTYKGVAAAPAAAPAKKDDKAAPAKAAAPAAAPAAAEKKADAKAEDRKSVV